MKSPNSLKNEKTLRYLAGGYEERVETLAVESPLQVKVNGESFTTTLRTPGDDEALARGLLYTEEIVPNAMARVEFECVEDPETGVVASLDARVAESDIAKAVAGKRTMMSSSSCGVCGTRELEDLNVYGPSLPVLDDETFDLGRIPTLMEVMSAHQPLFAKCGGVHAAAIFSKEEVLLFVAEDIGRHNAVDKAVGTLLRDGALDAAAILLVSGRVSYEIVYKAYRAGIPVLLAISAPSSMAVESAERFGMTLVAFCRDDRATVYAGRGRIAQHTVSSNS